MFFSLSSGDDSSPQAPIQPQQQQQVPVQQQNDLRFAGQAQLLSNNMNMMQQQRCVCLDMFVQGSCGESWCFLHEIL